MSKRRTRLRSDCSIIMVAVSAIVSSLVVLAYDCIRSDNCVRLIKIQPELVPNVKRMVD